MAEYVRLRAPQEHGRALQIPPLHAGAALIAANRRRFDSFPTELDAIREMARGEIVDAANQHSRAYLDEVPISQPLESSPIIVGGHQPQLFHPGVWFKNFALDSICRQVNGIGINLVVDNDLCSSSTIACPRIEHDGSVHTRQIAYDEPHNGIPCEMRRVKSPETFDSFPFRVCEAISPTVVRPIVEPLWHEVKKTSSEFKSMPARLAAGRHRMEKKLGLENLELPVSQMAGFTSFAKFAELIFKDSRRFVEVYNEKLIQYRALHRIRSRSHPVPELVCDREWVELPFWIWTSSNPIRRRLFSRPSGSSFQLADRNGWRCDIPSRDFAGTFVELNRASSEIHIRPRALATTMFARLFASDAFVHGIGGAKYDQLNDDMMRCFFEIEPPSWFTLTATMKLPFERATVNRKTLTALQQNLRELRFHPENVLPNHELAAAKRELIRDMPNRENKKLWHRKLEDLNFAMSRELGKQKADLRNRIWQTRQELPKSRILGSREYSFVLFPDQLAHRLKELARGGG